MRLVDLSTDKKMLPRFRPPKVKALRPACLVLIRGATMARSVDAISLGFLVVALSVPRSVPSQPLYGGPGSRVLPIRFTTLSTNRLSLWFRVGNNRLKEN